MVVRGTTIIMADSTQPFITVIVSWFNHPEHLLIHRLLWLKAFPKNIVRYVAYIDVNTTPGIGNIFQPNTTNDLIEKCKENKIEYVEIPIELHFARAKIFPGTEKKVDISSSARNSISCQLAWKQQVIEKPYLTRFIFVQQDVFPFKKQTWESLMMNKQIYYRPQNRATDKGSVDYAWEGLCAFDVASWNTQLKHLVSFEMGYHNNVYTDTGGGLWVILKILDENLQKRYSSHDSKSWNKNTPGIKIPDWIRNFCEADPRNENKQYYGEILDDWCFHLRGGSHYDRPQIIDVIKRYSLFFSSIYPRLQDNTTFLEDDLVTRQ